MTDIQQIKQISIRDYLTQRRINPKQQNTRYGLYLSPLREEHSPSFKVDYIQNLWYDFGLGVGGSIIDLVMHMERCNAAEAMRRLERHIDGMSVSSLSPSGFSSLRIGRAIQNCSALAPQRRFIGKNPAPQRSPSIIVEKVRPLENPA
ncbi:CHC2 zinc finger domain-containing protein [uncultured Alistipes sp.]|uniref:CHC2 zinc finger domain-containing protein n=1 Tax=uncultured Alistipes sp. TaxID=538949 RepID=UPI00321FD9F7